jgi:hypothetical protein
MRYVSAFAPQSRSRHGWSRVLLLAALCAILGIAQGLAQAPVAASPQAPAASAPSDVADFLATLSAPSGSQGAADLPPAPDFLQTSTGCTSDAQCPTGKLCCRDCAFPECTHKSCLTPMNGHCPLIP